jgi:AraC-like DNA-binding protein
MTVHLSEDWQTLAVKANYCSRELARQIGRSPRQLERIFRKQFARSPQSWLNEQRLFAAQILLLSGKPVKEVALGLGFKHSSHFCRQFKLTKKLTPSDFVFIAYQAVNDVAHS